MTDWASLLSREPRGITHSRRGQYVFPTCKRRLNPDILYAGHCTWMRPCMANLVATCPHVLCYLLQVRSAGYDSPMVFNCQMGAGRTTTGTVIGGLLAMYGHGHPAPPGGLSAGGSFAYRDTSATAGSGAAAGAAAGSGAAATPPPIVTGGRGQGSGTVAAAGGGAEGLVDGLNEDQSRDILREEIAGDSPRCSGRHDESC